MIGFIVAPSSRLRTYPVIGHPPLQVGSVHFKVIVVDVVETKIGELRPEGAEQVQIVAMTEAGPKPLKFSA